MAADMDLQLDEAEHKYTLNGRPVPGVTTVLQPLQQLDGIPWETLEAARTFGQHVHQACHLHNLGDLDWDTLDERLAAYVRGYLKFLADAAFVVLASETRVASPKYGYAGTLDLFGTMKRGDALIDIKSTASLPRTVGPQTSAYQQALLETTGQKTKRRYCLHVKPDDYKLVELTDGRGVQDFNIFLSALNLHRWRASA